MFKKTLPLPCPQWFYFKSQPDVDRVKLKCSCSSRVMRGSQCLAKPWNIEYLRCISKHVLLKFVIVHKQQHIAFNKALGSWIELMKLANKSQLRWFWEKEVLLLLWLWRWWFSLHKPKSNSNWQNIEKELGTKCSFFSTTILILFFWIEAEFFLNSNGDHVKNF